jgi:hypothetical protein
MKILLKSLGKKRIYVNAYVRKDGVQVEGHGKTVNYQTNMQPMKYVAVHEKSESQLNKKPAQTIAQQLDAFSGLMKEGIIQVDYGDGFFTNTEAIYDPIQDKIILYADSIQPDDLLTVVAHELIHRAEYVDPEIKAACQRFEGALQKRFDKNAKGEGSRMELEAYKRVIDAGTPERLQMQEYRAYLGQQFVEEPGTITGEIKKFFEELVAAIRVALLRHGIDFGDELTPADYFQMTKYGQTPIKHGYNGLNLSATRPSLFYSALRRALQIAPDKVFAGGAAQVKAWLKSNAAKLGVKTDEIFWSGIEDYLDLQASQDKKPTKADLNMFMLRSGEVIVKDVELGIPEEDPLTEEEREEYDDLKGLAGFDNTMSEAERERFDDLSRVIGEHDDLEAKYGDSEYKVRGGKDYRELVVTMPRIDPWGVTDEAHFGDVGGGKQVFWMRFDTRTDADGNEGLLVSEFQSKRGMEGRAKGFKEKGVISLDNNSKISPAPFITTAKNKASDAYLALLMKKAVIRAIYEGKTFVAWATGAQQADFYDLSKTVERIDYGYWLDKVKKVHIKAENGDEYRFEVDESGKVIRTDAHLFEGATLDDIVGKEHAKTILEADKSGDIAGADLKIDAPWTARMYGDEQGLDKDGKPAMITQVAMEIAKKMGGKVGNVTIAKPTSNIHVEEISVDGFAGGLEAQWGVYSEGKLVRAFDNQEWADEYAADMINSENIRKEPPSSTFEVRDDEKNELWHTAKDLEEAEKFISTIPSMKFHFVEIKPPASPFKSAMQQPALIITPEMKEKVLAEGFPLFSKRTKEPPKRTIKAYKLLRLKKGKLYSMMINPNTKPIPLGEWLDADIEDNGGLALRPGWHAAPSPFAKQLGGKDKGLPNYTSHLPNYRKNDEVWVEVEIAADENWQPEANRRGVVYKTSNPKTGAVKGKLNPATAEIKDEIPVDGYYRYKTSANMAGRWFVSGAIKHNRILSDDEVLRINKLHGVSDLPRKEPLDLVKLGFGQK